MKKAIFTAIVAAPLAAISSTAVAGKPVDNYGLAAISVGDLRAAEAQLMQRLYVAPHDVTALLNLAMVYRKTGRVAQADELYTRVLTRDDVLLDARNGATVWAHDLAKAKRTTTIALATR